MALPKTFQFSATSLQDYVDCPRRFQLRYLLQVVWPAPEAKPIGEQERHGRLARDFHQLVHQYLLGLPTEVLSNSVHDPDLQRWWQAFLAFVPTFGNARVIPELGLSAPLAGYRVMAQYDAVVVSDQPYSGLDGSMGMLPEHGPSLLIVDWKTYRQRPSRTWLAQRLQSRVYPVILVRAGKPLISSVLSDNASGSVEPDHVEMCYWLVEYPQAPETFPYDVATYRADTDYLASLITEIARRASDSRPEADSAPVSTPGETWPLTTEPRNCCFCNYRSFCGRGGVAGPVDEYMEDGYPGHRLTTDENALGFDLDWGQVQEIAY